METQKKLHVPYAIIRQASHSKLAGDLALLLRDDVFGALPSEVIRAISEHDWGWQESDELQMDKLGEHEPQPFPRLSVPETLPSWNESVAHARQLGALEYVIVSRHFTTLGASDEGRAAFVHTENQRRAEVEHELPYTAVELQRWTGAIGFCDLLSLYLCSGSKHPVEFPLAHPADPASSQAGKVTLSWENDSPRFSEPVLRAGETVSLDAERYAGSGTELTPLTLSWHFPVG